MSDVLNTAAIEAQLKSSHEQLEAFIAKSNQEIAEHGKATTKTLDQIEALSAKTEEMGDRLFAIEQQGAGAGAPEGTPSIGAQFTASEGFKAVAEGRSNKARLNVNAAITNATGSDQPLVDGDRLPGIIHTANRRLTIRDLLPTGMTTSNLVEYAQENVFTNSAGVQANEGDTKAESDITFTLGTAPVVTLAHFIVASKQVLDDSQALESYINNRLTYGLKLKEEDQLLNGDGLTGNISGLVTNQTAAAALSGSKVDQIRQAIAQAHASEYAPTAIILNPADWSEIELDKGTDGHYTWTNPAMAAAPMLWGLPVIATNSMAAGSFQVGAYDMAAQIWDRQQSTVEISTENSDNFVKNMCTVRAEERLALAIYRSSAIVGGTFAAVP